MKGRKFAYISKGGRGRRMNEKRMKEKNIVNVYYIYIYIILLTEINNINPFVQFLHNF